MWIILKFDNKYFELLKKDLKEKLGAEISIYRPKFLVQKYKNNKVINKELNVLGDYLFCFHKDFINSQSLNKFKFIRGLKYFLTGFSESQEEIVKFIKKCRSLESKEGYLSYGFYDLNINSEYQFSNGPFANLVCKILEFQKNKIQILIGNLKTTIEKNKFLFKPV